MPLQLHYLRATVLQKALRTPNVTVPSAYRPDMVVRDFCASHRLKESVHALTEAIIFAVDRRSKYCI